jgi:hypothetical protein
MGYGQFENKDPACLQACDEQSPYEGEDEDCKAKCPEAGGTSWLVYLGVGVGVGAVAAMIVETVRK